MSEYVMWAVLYPVPQVMLFMLANKFWWDNRDLVVGPWLELGDIPLRVRYGLNTKCICYAAIAAVANVIVVSHCRLAFHRSPEAEPLDCSLLSSRVFRPGPPQLCRNSTELQ